MRIIFAVMMLSICGKMLAQYPTSGVPPTWNNVLGEKKWDHIGDFVFSLYEDSSDGSKYAVASIYHGKAAETIEIPSKVEYEGITYTVKGISTLGCAKIDGYETLVIPSTVSFIHGAKDNQKLKNIIFPQNTQLKTIGDRCFEGLELENITIPETVDSIGCRAFEGCKKLRSITLPRYIHEIKDHAFMNCSSLSTIYWSRDMYPNGDAPWDEQKKWLKHINKGVFWGCLSLTEFYYPHLSGGGAYCDGFSIAESAFYGCTNLRQVIAGCYITSIGSFAFFKCNSLRLLKGGINKGQMRIFNIKDNTSKEEDYRIFLQDSIGKYAFSECKNIDNIYFDHVKSIGDCAFDNCTSLRYVRLNGIEQMGNSVFSHCTALEDVTLDTSLKIFDSSCFYDCYSLKNVSGLSADMDFKGDILAIPNAGGMPTINEIGKSYSYFAKLYIQKRIEAWQKKKEYESTANWKKRVTEQTRKAKVKQLKDSARIAYIRNNRPKELSATIDSYDSDMGVFKIKVDNLNTYLGWSYILESADQKKERHAGPTVYMYANVPNEMAPLFKENWKNVKMTPTYCIAKNYLGIASCKFTLNGKTYTSPTLYDDETANVQLDLPPLEIDLGGNKRNDMAQKKQNLGGNKRNDMAQSKQQTPIDNTLDMNIPANTANNKNTFAVVIGNEKYGKVAQVPYANNDARIFAEYCKKTLGLPAQNVKVYENASYGTMIGAVSNIQKIAKAYKGDINVIFYYAGHGIPDEATGDGYLLPVDADGLNMRVCYPLSQLYKELGDMQVKSVTCFMDACFSGAQRGNGMIVAARGVAIKAKADAPQGNTVVFTAATDKQTAYPYKEKGHGMFTYYLLKKLRETKGDCTLGELGAYISDQVAKQAVVTNGKEQTPVVLTSQGIANDWKNLKLR